MIFVNHLRIALQALCLVGMSAREISSMLDTMKLPKIECLKLKTLQILDE